MYISHPRARRTHRNCPTYIHPPRVGMIYPIPTYVSNCQECPKLLAVNIPYLNLLASQSDAHRIAPHRDPIQSQTQTHPSTYSSKQETHDVIYFLKGNRTRTSKIMFPGEKQEPR